MVGPDEIAVGDEQIRAHTAPHRSLHICDSAPLALQPDQPLPFVADSCVRSCALVVALRRVRKRRGGESSGDAGALPAIRSDEVAAVARG